MKESFDILIVGIGGQGTILASKILGEACLIEGRSVRGAETHGMAQRGGSVESHIRINGKFGPLIVPGTADLLIAFDLLEGLRYSHYLGEGGRLYINHALVVPTSVFAQAHPPPSKEDLLSRLIDRDICLIEADSLAVKAGNPLAVNVVMLGAASRRVPLARESLLEAIRRIVPPNTTAINTKAFEIGEEAGNIC